MASDGLGSPRITSDCIRLPRIASDCLGLPLIVASDCLGLPRIAADCCLGLVHGLLRIVASDCCLGLPLISNRISFSLLMAGLARLLLPSHAVRRCEAVYDNLARGDLRAGPRGDEI